jgi:general secretion pathway protein N
MKRISSIIPFVLISVAVLIWNYPVYAVSEKIESASAGKLRVLDSSGSIWNGQLHLGLFDGTKMYAIADAVKWKLQFLLNDHWLGVDLEHPIFLKPVHLGIGSQGVHSSGGELRIPASWLGALGVPFNTIRPEGMLHLSWVEWRSGESIEAVLTWIDAQSALTSVRPIGEYVVALTGNPDTTITLSLSTSKGPLILDGNGNWTKERGFVFNGYASAQEPSKEALTGLLSQMGRHEGDRYRLGVF